MQRHIQIDGIEGEKSPGIITVGTEHESIIVQVTAQAAPMDSAYIFLNEDEAKELAAALAIAISELQRGI